MGEGRIAFEAGGGYVLGVSICDEIATLERC